MMKSCLAGNVGLSQGQGHSIKRLAGGFDQVCSSSTQ